MSSRDTIPNCFGVPGTPYLTAWANSGKSGSEQALRLMAIRQARLEPLALSVSGRERMFNGWAAAGGEKRIDFSAGVARFGAILKELDRSLRSGPVRPLAIRQLVAGSSQWVKACARPDPAFGGVGREGGKQWPGRWRPPRFPEC